MIALKLSLSFCIRDLSIIHENSLRFSNNCLRIKSEKYKSLLFDLQGFYIQSNNEIVNNKPIYISNLRNLCLWCDDTKWIISTLEQMSNYKSRKKIDDKYLILFIITLLFLVGFIVIFLFGLYVGLFQLGLGLFTVFFIII